MTIEEYNEKYKETQEEIQKLEDINYNCQNLKRTLEMEYEDEEWEIKQTMRVHNEIMEDWYQRNMLTGAENLFETGNQLMRELLEEKREFYINKLEQIDNHLKNNLQQQEQYYESLQTLKREFERQGEEIDGENY